MSTALATPEQPGPGVNSTGQRPEPGGVDCLICPLKAKLSEGPEPHRHPYDEVQIVREWRGLSKVRGVEFAGNAGEVFVIKAGEVHEFKAIGDTNLGQVNVHMSPRRVHLGCHVPSRRW